MIWMQSKLGSKDKYSWNTVLVIFCAIYPQKPHLILVMQEILCRCLIFLFSSNTFKSYVCITVCIVQSFRILWIYEYLCMTHRHLFCTKQKPPHLLCVTVQLVRVSLKDKQYLLDWKIHKKLKLNQFELNSPTPFPNKLILNSIWNIN